MNEKKIELRPMPAGCYQLAQDVTNPKPDKRAHRDWTNHVTWKKGTRLYLRESVDVDFMEKGKHVTTWQIENIDERWVHMNIRRGQHDGLRWNAITAHMVPVPESLEFLLHRLDAGGWTRYLILQQLVNDKLITLQQIEEAYRKAMTETEHEGVKAAVLDNSDV